MKVAITIWGTRISPVFDSARNLLIVEIRGNEIVDRKNAIFDGRLFGEFLRMLLEHNVRVLICGALCEGPSKILEAHGIDVLQFLTGEVETVLAGFVRGADLTDFSLPGCRWGLCRRRGRIRRTIDNQEVELCPGVIDRAAQARVRKDKKGVATVPQEPVPAAEQNKADKREPATAAGEADREAARGVADRSERC